VTAAAPLALVRVRLKYPDVETLIERFSPNVTRGGIFLASRDPRPVGTAIRFEVSLLGGQVVMAGEGKVTWVKEYDPATPTRPHGMGVSFTRLDSNCREMWKRLIERREATARPRTPAAGTAVGSPRTLTPGSRDAVAADLEAVDDAALRRAVERARNLAGRIDNVDELLAPDAPAPVPELREALADLPRYLQSRRGTGANRITEAKAEGAKAEGNRPAASPAEPEPS
jgi:molecular chaperone DnaK